MGHKNYTDISEFVNQNKKRVAVSTWGGSKELGSYVVENTNTTSNEIQERVEHRAEQEVRPFVQPRSETIDIPPDLKHFGLQPVNNTQFSNYQNITLPIADEKIVFGLHAPITSSIRWLATLAILLLHKAHIGLKTVHGKVIRVIKP